MADVVDLSQLGNKTELPEADVTVPVFEDLTEEQQAALADKADPNEGFAVRTAFLVFIDYDNNVFATDDIDAELNRDHSPSKDEIYGALAVLQKDIAAQDTSAHLQLALQQQAAQMMQAQEEAKVRAALQGAGGPKGNLGPKGGRSGNPARR